MVRYKTCFSFFLNYWLNMFIYNWLWCGGRKVVIKETLQWRLITLAWLILKQHTSEKTITFSVPSFCTRNSSRCQDFLDFMKTCMWDVLVTSLYLHANSQWLVMEEILFLELFESYLKWHIFKSSRIVDVLFFYFGLVNANQIKNHCIYLQYM